MKIFNKIKDICQSLLIVTIVLSISANCCLQHEYLDITKNSKQESKHDCCKGELPSKSSDSSQESCLDCGHQFPFIASSPLELSKLKIIQQNYPAETALIGMSQFVNYDLQSSFGHLISNQIITLPPNYQLLESLSISPNGPPVLI